MGVRERKSKIVESNDHRGLAEGLVEYLEECRNGVNRRIFTTATEHDEVVMMVEEYLRTLEQLPIEYTRAQYINDLILLLKSGQGSVAGHLKDVMGFASESEDLVFNIIDYSSIEDCIKEASEPDYYEEER